MNRSASPRPISMMPNKDASTRGYHWEGGLVSCRAHKESCAIKRPCLDTYFQKKKKKKLAIHALKIQNRLKPPSHVYPNETSTPIFSQNISSPPERSWRLAIAGETMGGVVCVVWKREWRGVKTPALMTVVTTAINPRMRIWIHGLIW